MATVNKNFRIKNGLIVEGASGTIDGFNILTESQSSQDFIVNIIGGTATSANTPDTVVKRDGFGNFTAGQIDLESKLTTPDVRIADAGKIYVNGSDLEVKSYDQNNLNLVGQNNVNITTNNGDIVLNADGSSYLYNNNSSDNRIATEGWANQTFAGFVTETGQQTLSNKELVNPLINGQIRLEDSNGTFEALISLSSDELVLDTDSRNIILSPEGGNVYIQNSNFSDNIVVTQGDLNVHSSATSSVHGVNGNIVGTSDAQTLSNKIFAGPVVFQSGGGAGGTNNNIDVNNNTGELIIHSGYSLNLNASNDVTVTSNGGNVILNPDGDAYLWSSTPGNKIATRNTIDYLIGDNTVDGTTGNTIKNRIDSAVAAVVDSAPATLDTLKELATALQDNPDIISNLQQVASGKQGTLTPGDGIYIDGDNVITGRQQSGGGLKFVGSEAAIDRSTVDSWYDATGAASQAETNAKSYADDLASNYDASGAAAIAESNANSYTDNAISNGNVNAEPIYKGVKLGYYTELISGWASTSNGSSFIPVTWDSMYGTAKMTVHVRDGVHSQASELLIARDSSNNLHITEYAIVTTNGVLADISASYSNGIVSLTVSPTNGHTYVEAVATGSVVIWAD